jgi:hypothetical protein
MSSRKTDKGIPDWKLERYLLGELDPEELRRIRQDVESNEPLQLQLEALKRSDREIRERYPAAWMSRQIQRKMIGSATQGREVKSRLWSRFWLLPAVPVGAVAAIVLALLVLPDTLTRHDGNQEGLRVGDSTRIKGLEAELRLFRKTETGSEPLRDGAVAREHDLVLIQYRAAAKAYGVIVSVDGRGTVTRHLPSDRSQAVQLQTNGIVSLDFAYELDDAPRYRHVNSKFGS